MRLILKKGKQKELIHLSKKDLSWKELSKKLNCSQGYLRNELNQEKRTLDKKLYEKLCRLAKTNFDKFILESLEDNWGKSKGGINSPKNIKKFLPPKENEELAEIIGVILGDGHVEELIISKKIRCYSITIAGNSDTDKDYIFNYIPSLFEKVFNEKGKSSFSKDSNTGYFKIHGKNLVGFIKEKGIKPGNKKKNNQGIPEWIKQNKSFLRKCIKGLIDTDGSIHYISKNNKNLRIDFTSYIPKLLNDARQSLIKLGFNPSKIISRRHFFLSRKEEIKKYIKEIGFANEKNLKRLKQLSGNTPS